MRQTRCLTGCLLWVFIVFSAPAWAERSFFELRKDELHCGYQTKLNLYEGLMSVFSDSKASLSELHLRKPEHEFKLELIVHYPPTGSKVPDKCKPHLLKLSQLAKKKKIGDLLIRSSAGAHGSTELGLAIANERLERVKQFFRGDRLARRALILELHPLTSSNVLQRTIDKPEIVEIYSSPVNYPH